MIKRNKLNVQGLARRDPGFMTCLVSAEGTTFVSIDATAAEPTVSTYLTKDPMYSYASFDGVGIKPYYGKGILFIDDIYLMYASVCPVFSSEIRKVFSQDENCELWLTDSDAVKEKLKHVRKHAKTWVLAFAYGLGPKRLRIQAYEAGFDLSEQACRDAYMSFWDLFKRIRAFANKLTQHVEKKGYVINPFGYRLTPQPHKAYNAVIQSSVSGIMHRFCMLITEIAPWADFVTIIHDEVIYEIRDDRLDEFKRVRDEATERLNADLGWDVQLRYGWAIGKNLYDAK